ncbi:MAG TPA: DUF3179 domain-containing protein, partial [Sneathiellales bacterium]|nr:DUF3179 domain-containing protein [Sneathiellales bacterium]
MVVLYKVDGSKILGIAFGAVLLDFIAYMGAATAYARPSKWRHEWPRTDFSVHSVDYLEICSGGPPKNGIPPIDRPQFQPQTDVTGLGPQEPVISVVIKGDARA